MSPISATFPRTPITSGHTGSDHVHTRLAWTPADPAAVAVHVASGGPQRKPTTWLFARQLLRDGINHPTGIGDVTITPHPYKIGIVEVMVRAAAGIGGNAVLHYPAAALTGFLHNTDQAVHPSLEDDVYRWDIADLFRRETA